MKIFALRAALVLCAAWAIWRSAAQAPATLSVEIRDDATGEIVPAMVCITSLADGKWHVPPDGATPPYSTLRDFYEPKPWTPGQIGPVRKTTGEQDDNQTRSAYYEKRISYPYWREPAAWFATQPFSMPVGAGKWRLAVARGFEYIPVAEEFEVADGARARRVVRLKRWVDMPKLGWYSGDTHVHYPRTTAEQSDFLLAWARAEDVHLTTILSFGDIQQTYFDQMGYGRDAAYGKGAYLLASGQEDPRTQIPEQGHTIALDIRATVRDVSRYHLYDTMFDGVHRQGGLAGYAHLAWGPEVIHNLRPNVVLYPTWDTNINVIRGKVDFFEILQFRHMGLEDYYDFLSLGCKLTADAGSDMPWASSIGEVRTYVYTGGKFSAGAWYDAFKAGHTFVTNGPMLTLTVDKAIPGDEVRLDKPRKLRVHARAWAHAAIGAPKLVQVIAEGKEIRSAAAQVDFELTADRSQWIAAKVTTENGEEAHTSPVYVIVGGHSFRDETYLADLVAKRTKVLDFIEARLADARFTREYAAGEADALRERIAEARRAYRRLLSGG
jgi:hypothetical protein